MVACPSIPHDSSSLSPSRPSLLFSPYTQHQKPIICLHYVFQNVTDNVNETLEFHNKVFSTSVA